MLRAATYVLERNDSDLRVHFAEQPLGYSPLFQRMIISQDRDIGDRTARELRDGVNLGCRDQVHANALANEVCGFVGGVSAIEDQNRNDGRAWQANNLSGLRALNKDFIAGGSIDAVGLDIFRE